jgi:hypothetical protein
MEIIQWDLNCSVQMNRQADMTKLIVAFCNFANAPKKEFHSIVPVGQLQFGYKMILTSIEKKDTFIFMGQQ